MMRVGRDSGFMLITMFGVTAMVLSVFVTIAMLAHSLTIASPMHLWLIGGLVPLVLGLGAARIAERVSASPLLTRIAATSAFAIVMAAFTLIATIFTIWLMIAGNRVFVLPIACVQFAVLRAFVAAPQRGPLASLALLLASCIAWTIATPLSFVQLNEILMSASAAYGFGAIVFVLCLLLFTNDVVSDRLHTLGAPWRRRLELLAATAIFTELALRVDHLGSDWIPYHRSYWAGPADFIRQGHWLLWDVPSQYGLFSELAVALMPARDVWQGLFLTTALVLVLQAVMTFMVLRDGRSGRRSFWIALALCVAVFFTSEAARHPYAARLYPQQGLRFLWQSFALFSVWKTYIYREQSVRARFYRIFGWLGWTCSLFWSFEAAIWTSLVWIAFIGTEMIVAFCSQPRTLTERAQHIVRTLLPAFVLPAVVVTAIELFYRIHLGHGPDWLGYFEFSSVYANSDVAPLPIRVTGPGLVIVGYLCAIAAVGYVVCIRRIFHALPIVAAAFAATWGISIYYAGEPYDAHVNAMMEVFVMAFALLAAVLRREAIVSPSGLLARTMFLPTCVILTMAAILELMNVKSISAPFFPHYSIDSTLAYPAITGELRTLIKQTGDPNTKTILPNRATWVKPDLGMVMPFLQEPDGTRRELHAWLPMSPVGSYNTLYTLPLERRQTYIERYLQTGNKETGWFITYHGDARCDLLSPQLRTQRMLHSENFTASYCVLR